VIACEGRTTILPGLEPTVFVVLTEAAVGAMFVFWWFVVVGAKAPRRDSHLFTDSPTTNANP
jgi:hypothetical protein